MTRSASHCFLSKRIDPMRSKAGLLFKRITAVVAITLMLSPLALAQERGNSESVRVNVDLVRVPVSVTQRGIPVKGLTMDTFQLREDSTPQVIQYFWQELDLPLSIGLIVDVSGSQAGLVGKHKQTVTTFLKQVLGPEDRAMLITVSSQARLVTDFTNSIDELSRGIDRIKRLGGKSDPIIGEPCRGTHHRTALLRRRLKASPCGGTALWQGVYSAAHFKMKNIEGRKALIILFDGIAPAVIALLKTLSRQPKPHCPIHWKRTQTRWSELKRPPKSDSWKQGLVAASAINNQST
jgi:VWFA-related protein